MSLPSSPPKRSLRALSTPPPAPLTTRLAQRPPHQHAQQPQAPIRARRRRTHDLLRQPHIRISVLDALLRNRHPPRPPTLEAPMRHDQLPQPPPSVLIRQRRPQPLPSTRHRMRAQLHPRPAHQLHDHAAGRSGGPPIRAAIAALRSRARAAYSSFDNAESNARSRDTCGDASTNDRAGTTPGTSTGRCGRETLPTPSPLTPTASRRSDARGDAGAGLEPAAAERPSPEPDAASNAASRTNCATGTPAAAAAFAISWRPAADTRITILGSELVGMAAILRPKRTESWQPSAWQP